MDKDQSHQKVLSIYAGKLASNASRLSPYKASISYFEVGRPCGSVESPPRPLPATA